MNKTVCKTCMERDGRAKWNIEDEKDWNRGIIVCPGKVWTVNLSPYRVPDWCKYALEHLVAGPEPKEKRS